MAPSGGVAFGGLCGRSMSVHGTFPTCRVARMMSGLVQRKWLLGAVRTVVDPMRAFNTEVAGIATIVISVAVLAVVLLSAL